MMSPSLSIFSNMYLIVMTHPCNVVSQRVTGSGVNRKCEEGSNRALAASDLSNQIRVTIVVFCEGSDGGREREVMW